MGVAPSRSYDDSHCLLVIEPPQILELVAHLTKKDLGELIIQQAALRTCPFDCYQLTRHVHMVSFVRTDRQTYNAVCLWSSNHGLDTHHSVFDNGWSMIGGNEHWWRPPTSITSDGDYLLWACHPKAPLNYPRALDRALKSLQLDKKRFCEDRRQASQELHDNETQWRKTSPKTGKPNTSTHGYGHFRKLPLEIRQQVWRCLMREHNEDQPQQSQAIRSMSILRTSKLIYSETIPVLYQDRTLWIWVDDYCCGAALADTKTRAIREDFTNANLAMFPNIRIDIYRPCLAFDPSPWFHWSTPWVEAQIPLRIKALVQRINDGIHDYGQGHLRTRPNVTVNFIDSGFGNWRCSHPGSNRVFLTDMSLTKKQRCGVHCQWNEHSIVNPLDPEHIKQFESGLRGRMIDTGMEEPLSQASYFSSSEVEKIYLLNRPPNIAKPPPGDLSNRSLNGCNPDCCSKAPKSLGSTRDKTKSKAIADKLAWLLKCCRCERNVEDIVYIAMIFRKLRNVSGLHFERPTNTKYQALLDYGMSRAETTVTDMAEMIQQAKNCL
ncbi:MAG: hypothetical protein LQ342_005602 [Letrouitia transgressa]|nr:MAG: hypothetical protein LQ342_005602 [Letrouitia transgressa]